MATRAACAEPRGCGDRAVTELSAAAESGARCDAGSPSPWVVRFSHLVRPGGRVLDVAAGTGRHVEWFLGHGHAVLAVDRDVSRLRRREHARLQALEVDLEGSGGWPLAGERFDAVVVTNYLWRPALMDIVRAVADDGVLIYETFGEGNERHGRPRRPEFLLRPAELLDSVLPALHVVAYENGYLERPSARVVQRICAVGRARRTSECAIGAPQGVDACGLMEK